MKLKSKKSALLLSFTSLLLCFAMLAGSTFAWFTDTATTGVNKIVAGNLKVDIIGATDENHVEKLEFTKARAADAEAEAQIFWEPGCRYLTQGFRIANKGNLALKWKAQVNKGTTAANEGGYDLLDVIDFYLVKNNINEDGTPLGEFTGNLTAGAKTSDVYYIKGVMQTTAGNNYQNLTLDGITITVYATQDTVENDSFNNTYDENATYYPVLDAAGLKDALVNGGNIKVDSSFDAGEDTLTVEKNTVLDMNGKTISNEKDIWDADTKTDWSLISARNGANLTITGNGSFKAKKDDCYAVDVQDGATVTIEDGTFIGNIHAVYVYEGTANIKGGFYAVQQKYTDANKADGFVLNCYDANRTGGTAKIIVTGGTFVNFNPADCWAEGEHTNFVADGYSVISEQHGADTWYTVVKGTGVVAGSQKALNEGIANSATKDVTVVMPANSSVTLDNGIANDDAKARDITFVGDGSQTVDIHTDNKGENGNKLNYQRGSTFTFENLTVTAATSGNYEGIVCDGLTYKNCTIKGIQWLYAENVEFINCKFIQENDDTYHLWTYGAKNVTFTDCEFSSTSKSKAVLCYTDAENGKTYTRTFNNCTFRATGEAEKSAIMINPSAHSNVNTYVININNCTATGYAENGISGQTIVGVKETVKDAITVTINGTTVYTN